VVPSVLALLDVGDLRRDHPALALVQVAALQVELDYIRARVSLPDSGRPARMSSVGRACARVSPGIRGGRSVPEPKDFNIVVPGTFGVYSSLHAPSTPWLYSASFNNCVGLVLRGKDVNGKPFAVFAHFFGGGHQKVGQSWANIQGALTQLDHGGLPQEGLEAVYFYGLSPNDNSNKVRDALVTQLGGAATVHPAAGRYPNALVDAMSGKLCRSSENLFNEMKARGLTRAANSADDNLKPAKPLVWNRNYKASTEPQAFTDKVAFNWIEPITEPTANQPFQEPVKEQDLAGGSV
jgi:hypothetical protein